MAVDWCVLTSWMRFQIDTYTYMMTSNRFNGECNLKLLRLDKSPPDWTQDSVLSLHLLSRSLKGHLKIFGVSGGYCVGIWLTHWKVYQFQPKLHLNETHMLVVKISSCVGKVSIELISNQNVLGELNQNGCIHRHGNWGPSFGMSFGTKRFDGYLRGKLVTQPTFLGLWKENVFSTPCSSAGKKRRIICTIHSND